MEVKELINDLSTFCSISLALTLLLILILIGYFTFKRRNLPPGPTGLPYLGYFPFLKNETFMAQMEEFTKKYGDVFSMTITGRLFIHLGSCKALREAHISKGDCFDGRMSNYNYLRSFFEHAYGFTKGENSHVFRKYLLAVLKRRTLMSENKSVFFPVYDSIKSTVDGLRNTKGKPVNLIRILIDGCANNLRLMLFDNVGASEEEIRRIAKLHAAGLPEMKPLNFLINGPLARFVLCPLNPGICKSLENSSEMIRIASDIVERHKSTYDEDNVRDMVDEYFKERDLRQKRGDPTAKYFTDIALIHNIVQLVSEGVVDIAATINVITKFLIEIPEEQEKIYKEIVEVVGADRQPTIADRSKLPYFNAFIYEALRMTSVFNVVPGWECIKETTLNGYRIPKGAVTILNFTRYKYDPEVYEEPHKFNPSRFLPEDGKKGAELPYVFGIGKRSCIGEAMALTHIFLILATIVQNFHLMLPEDENLSKQQNYLRQNMLICAHPREHT